MKIICSKTNLTNGVNIVSKAVPSKTSLSILQCILINAEKGVITLTANDTELGIETTIEGTIEEEGNVALDAKFLSEIVRKLPDNQVEIEVDQNYITKIKCEKTFFNLIGKDGEDFTGLPKISKTDSVVISELSLKDVIKQTIFCLSDNNANHMMSSELFEISKDVLKVVALDGYRIAYRKINLKNSYPDVKVIIPGKTLNEISRILSGEENKEVEIFFEKNHVLFEFDNTKIVSRLVEGQYFNYEQMLNNDYETKFEINKRELYDSIDRSTLLLREGEIKPIIMDIKDNELNISIKTMVGEMKEDVSVVKTGKDLTIAFRPKFILDVLRVLEEDQIKVYTINAKSPCIIKDDEGSYIYFILPVNFVR
ncbi:MAG: DNA polymerase III subunit beta [Lachnospiraceae bacterium]|jgi:DNA polymerase-3 subunit beta|nr:DNA polymerase III subunit beta [Lachnospiraceae bacterium]